MSREHLNDEQLLDRLYGIADPGAHDHHLAGCDTCSARWEAVQARKAELAAPPEVATDVLAAQRRAIYARVGERPRSSYRWAPAVAAAGLIVGAFLVNRPMTEPPTAPLHVTAPAHSDAADAQLFAEVYSMRDSMESRAAAPIRALFEDQE